MINLIKGGVYFAKNTLIPDDNEAKAKLNSLGIESAERESAKKGTIAYSILSAHNKGDESNYKIKFDAMASHDITYVGVIQTARASGLREFPIPYVLTNCHNSLCAVGGTINEDDHVFGLSAAKKYGGIFVPAHQAVIHSYMREMMSGCGKMILGSDSHTRYGALGTMAVGEGGPELVKQLLGRTYDIAAPEVIAVRLTGKPKAGVGPQDVAIAIIGAVFKNGFVKNKVLEFVGDGIANLPIEFRNGIDVMTTETTCLSSIWVTDSAVKAYYENHGRPDEFKPLAPADVAYYDGAVDVDLSLVEPMIALPFHPSNAFTIREFKANAADMLRTVEADAVAQLGIKEGKFTLTDKIDENGNVRIGQGVIAGCAGGTYDNLAAAADILSGADIGSGAFALSVYPGSQPIFMALINSGAAASLMSAGAVIRSAFCGPCFGAGDVPANNTLSIRHSTRNFPNREGSKPSDGQIAAVALMDARSIAATALNGGKLTGADEIEIKTSKYSDTPYLFDGSAYKSRVYQGFGHANQDEALVFGPGIADWPEIKPLSENIILRVASVITDPVTTTDELIPSGETSSYRSNPFKLSEFALSRKDPAYVGRAKETAKIDVDSITDIIGIEGICSANTNIGSVVCAVKPGDGSAREQAASCQRVLGGAANIANEYATKRYRSNLINWGMLPFITSGNIGNFNTGDYIVICGIKSAVADGTPSIQAHVISADGSLRRDIQLSLGSLTDDEKKIILAGCLINFYKNN